MVAPYIAAAIGATLLFGLAAVALKQGVSRGLPTLTFRELVDHPFTVVGKLLRNGMWLSGLALYGVGGGLYAVALAQLRKLDSAVLAVTQSHFGRLTRELSEACPGIRFRDTGDHGGDAGIALYIDRQTPDKGAWFGKALAAEGIPVGATTRVCNLLHSEYVQARRQTHPNMPPFGPVGSGDACTYSPACCPNTDAIIGSMVSTMITPRMTDSDIDDIRDAVTKVWRAQEVSR